MFCAYILSSEKLGYYYIGATSDFDVRLEFHKRSETLKFTGKANDWELFLKIPCENKQQALAIERHIKSMKSKIYIQNLLKYPEMISKLQARFENKEIC